MAVIDDPRTHFPLGDPEANPFPAAGENSALDIPKAVESMILSASGWRTVFTASGDEEDKRPEIAPVYRAVSALIADSFADFLAEKTAGNGDRARSGERSSPLIVLGIDSRPTGTAIADIMLRVFAGRGFKVQYLFITAAPEIMAYSREGVDGFVYISASHNPVGHNGVKFGLSDGGVIPGSDAAVLIAKFREKCKHPDAAEHAASLIAACPAEALASVYTETPLWKAEAVKRYGSFTREVVAGTADKKKQDELFDIISESIRLRPLGIVCDMNGSARTLSIDADFMEKLGIDFHAINNIPRRIVHAIIPEPENLVYCADEMERLHQKSLHPDRSEFSLGYMPDCDGDRGNIVYWNDRKGTAEVLKAQEVFALSVMSELAYLAYRGESSSDQLPPGKTAVAVNDPTSMRSDDIAAVFGAAAARAEVGEANVVNLARNLRGKGYTVRILGEGSNGGNITHPAAVRDPLNTIFALIKLLVLRDEGGKQGLFHIWCSRSGQENAYRSDFTLADVIATLPVYTTTGVSEPRALLQIRETNHGNLKLRYQKIFGAEWEKKRDELKRSYGITGWEAVGYTGTEETRNLSDFSLSGKGGLKIIFYDSEKKPAAFIWMRGSGTEPVFRILCDVKGDNPEMEAELLRWHTEMIRQADS
ncbi:MAG: phosphoglucomutase [Spirochaetaceae bacterium]|jgi:phosphoglucomutase|nr:phosphoglucomutase [Spirochaetaceae bacterium]